MADNFEKLECWKKCFELKVFIKEKVLITLPSSEKYDLHSQLLRASRSATANITEDGEDIIIKKILSFY